MCVRPAAWAWAMIDGVSPPSAYCGCQIQIPLPVGTAGAGGGGGGAVVVVGATVVVVGATVVEVVGATVVEVVVGATVVAVVVVTSGNAMWFRNIDALLGAPWACATPAMSRPSAAMTMGATTR